MPKRVVILGGGVAGMSAAHELVERGFEVEVFEKKSIPGGKARSIDVPNSGKDGRHDLPGEHGFRFFPRFYKHVTDTMKRIPYKNYKRGVYDNLVGTSRILMARFDKPLIHLLDRFPRNLKDLKVLFDEMFHTDLGITKEGKEFFAERVWQLMTSCKKRRIEEYERLGWWEYLEADRFNEAYQNFFAKGLTRTLVAAKAREASTKTGGDIFLQLIFDMLRPGDSTDRVLDGPTNDVWIDPWLSYLKERGVDYHLNTTVTSIQCDAKSSTITGVTVEQDGEERTVEADYYIGAVPVEVMDRLLTEEMTTADPTLKLIRELGTDVAWMNGVQLYLTEEINLVHGHAIYIDTPWALTSISQLQFWKDFNIKEYGDGTIKTVFSIDVSDWDSPGVLEHGPDKVKKSAKDCSKQEIIDEIWAQLKMSLNVEGKTILKDEMLKTWFIDPDIKDFPTSYLEQKPASKANYINAEPLLVNKTRTWELRPEAYTRIHNFLLASDYVRTNTDLATMEGANEAARRAVNTIIDIADVEAPYCKIWDLHEPEILEIMRRADKHRFNQGLPWNGKLPWTHRLLVEEKLAEKSIQSLFE